MKLEAEEINKGVIVEGGNSISFAEEKYKTSELVKRVEEQIEREIREGIKEELEELKGIAKGEVELTIENIVMEIGSVIIKIEEEINDHGGYEIDKVMKGIRREIRCAISSNDVSGFLKGVYREIERVLPELKGMRLQCLFREYGINDRYELEVLEAYKFEKYFDISFISHVLGKSFNPFLKEYLVEIADEVYGVVSDLDRMKRYREELEKHGISSREELLAKGVSWFKQTKFGVFGSGVTSFAKLILRRDLRGRTGKVQFVNLEDFKEIADRLYLEMSNDELEEKYGVKTEKEMLIIYRNSVEEHGVCNRYDFLERGVEWFRKTRFGRFGTGNKAFAKLILGKLEKGYTRKVEFEIIADILFGEVSEEEKLSMYRKAIEKHGVNSREDFLARGVRWFRTTSFGRFGTGSKAFAKLILGELEKGYIRKVEFEKIAENLYPIK